jgi:polysaccharide export outer membrane protein
MLMELTGGRFSAYVRKARHSVAWGALTVAISGCAVAPGMQMGRRAELESSVNSDTGRSQNIQFPINEITVSLVEKQDGEMIDLSSKDTSELFVRPMPYTVGCGDVLQITVWDHPELAAAAGALPSSNNRPSDPLSGFVVDDKGNIAFPYVGEVYVKGLSADDLQKLITSRLAQSFRNPQVTVRIASFRAKQYYVDGEVKTPGAQAISDVASTLYDAISHAGGFSENADQSRIVLVRAGKKYLIDFPRLLAAGMNPGSIPLQTDDLVSIPPRDESGAFVMGEVAKPAKAYPLRNGKLSLSEALLQAGSINSNSADAAQVYVIRGRGEKAKVYHLDAKSPVAMVLANDFFLQPNDIVYVDGNGLVRFSRVLSLLLPGISAGLTASLIAK